MQREDSSRKSADKGRGPLGLISRRIHDGAPPRTRSYSEVLATDRCLDHIVGRLQRNRSYMLLDTPFLIIHESSPEFSKQQELP